MADEFLYGINPALETLRAERRRVMAVYVNKTGASAPRMKHIATLIRARGIAMEPVDKHTLFELCRSTEHQGIVIRVSPYPYVPLDEVLKEQRVLLLDNIEDPQNTGAILRSAEGFGWHAAALSSKGVPGIYASVVKASAGATEHLRINQDHTANDIARRLMESGFTLVAMDMKGGDIDSLKLLESDRVALAIGGEHKAVGQYILNLAHHVVGIRQHGKVNSLNASVAAGIAMFILGRSRVNPA